MKVIDARNQFLERRTQNDVNEDPNRLVAARPQATVTSIFSKVPHSRSACLLDPDLYHKQKYLDFASSRNDLLARIEEIDSFARILKRHSDVLARDSKETLRQLREVLLVESRAKNHFSNND